jgi:hypothetical protein
MFRKSQPVLAVNRCNGLLGLLVTVRSLFSTVFNGLAHELSGGLLRWENAINLATDDRVAFASAFFDALAVQDCDSAARVPNQSGLLQRVRTQRHR